MFRIFFFLIIRGLGEIWGVGCLRSGVPPQGKGQWEQIALGEVSSWHKKESLYGSIDCSLEQPPWGHCWRFSRGYRQGASLIYALLPTEGWTRFLLTWTILWFYRLLFLPENTAYCKALFSWDIKILSGKLFCSSPLWVCLFSLFSDYRFSKRCS